MRYYVTLFDSNYLTRGLVMYRSLLRNEKDFHLWVICFDDLMYKILTKMNLEKVTLVLLNEIEDERLLAFKSTRPRIEYFFTCAPASILYVFNNFPEVETVTYLDADLMFFSPLEPIFKENPNASIFLTEHRFFSWYQEPEQKYGRFNVQFMMFRRNDSGLTALNWWFEKCLELRYESDEDNYGDQKCLDDWQERFDGVHVVQSLGAGLAPWNVSQYSLQQQEDQIFIETEPLIFYHYSGFRIYGDKWVYLPLYCPLRISKNIKNLIYKPYLKEMKKVYQDIKKIDSNFDKGIENIFFPLKPSDHWHNRFMLFLKEIYKGRYYLYSVGK
ncbi:glycosyltransferase [Geminocystis sp. GBBB08]|uniref:glycosyltransferase n=1 Tax=Geminocystis sp. GBBB08 TaxID=2604140 RepID=UPI0037C162C5